LIVGGTQPKKATLPTSRPLQGGSLHKWLIRVKYSVKEAS